MVITNNNDATRTHTLRIAPPLTAYADPVGRPRRPAPASQVMGWPDSPAADPAVEATRLLALNLRAALGTRSLRVAAAATGVDHTVIADILNGATWPDVNTLARLEHGLGADLWAPHRPA